MATEALDRPIFSSADGKPWTPFTWRFTGEAILRGIVILVLVYQVTLTILLAVNDAYHLDMYTLWAFTGYTIAAALLVTALFIESWMLTLMVLFALPLIAGTIVLVAALIIIIIARDATIYIDGSVCEMPPDDDAYSIEVLHTGDWLEHGVVVFNWLVVLLAGYEYFHYIVVRSLKSWNPVWQWLYFIYWMNIPLVPVVIYQAIFDAQKIYKTSFSQVELTFITLAIVWLWMLALWLIFTARYSRKDIREFWLPNAQEVRSGRLSGAGLPNPQAASVAVPTLINSERGCGVVL